jgi:hypothetical protein
MDEAGDNASANKPLLYDFESERAIVRARHTAEIHAVQSSIPVPDATETNSMLRRNAAQQTTDQSTIKTPNTPKIGARNIFASGTK